ncbi:MAG: L-asparaginase [Acidimicrobiaceae bacterium]|nr:L-asparaginase [Acidimicrobiaceae bacterium]
MNSATDAGDPLELFIRAASENVNYPCRMFKDPRSADRLTANRMKLGVPAENAGVMVIYTGGTIGCAPSDDKDPLSPQVVQSWPTLRRSIPALAHSTTAALNFRIDAVSFEVPLDSSNMTPVDWVAIAQLLRRFMDSYEGFVILHGTDTMVYSASALSFMISNLKKPVIFTGAQLSAIADVRSDGQPNLITSMLIANARYSSIPNVPEVCIFFNRKLLRGNRAIKMDADGFDAFDTPNFPPLGEVGSAIEIRSELVLRPGVHAVTVQDQLETNVVDIAIFPGIQDGQILGSILMTEGLKGVVLRTYGAGNMPTATNVLSQLNIARERGIVVVNVSQCPRGTVRIGLYETSALLLGYGVVSGVDITAQAALTKLMVLLGDPLLDLEEIPRSVQVALRGEQSESIYVSPLDGGGSGTLSSGQPSVWFRTKDAVFRPLGTIRKAVLVLYSVSVRPRAGADRVGIEVFLNGPAGEDVGPNRPGPACSVSRLATEEGDGAATLVFDVTLAMEQDLQEGRRNSFRISLSSGEDGAVTWTMGELAMYVEGPN